MKTRIHYTKPSITELEVEYATDAARNGWGENCYAYITRFEESFKSHLGVKHAIATSSCTGAIHMGLAALDIGPGDEVILADTNWIATAAPIVHLGARPVFVDILESTWCIDPELVEKAITARTKAIIAVHLYGNLCDLDSLLDIGKRYGIPVVEDAAEAIGSKHRGRRAGSIGHFGTFSFHGTKTLTTGEGGMFVTNDTALFETVLTLSNHGRGRNSKKQFWPELVGFKYKMSNIQAAIGCAQVERIDTLIRRKQEILELYRAELSGFGGAVLNCGVGDVELGGWMPTVVFPESTAVSRDLLQANLEKQNADARVFFHPLSSTGLFESTVLNPVANSIPGRAINMPSYHDMSLAEILRVCEGVRNCVQHKY